MNQRQQLGWSDLLAKSRVESKMTTMIEGCIYIYIARSSSVESKMNTMIEGCIYIVRSSKVLNQR